MPKRILQGVVKSAVNNKTISVLVQRTCMHSLYKKIVKKSKKYSVHDENNQCKVGDIVKIQESRPISKNKFWVVLS